MVAAPARPAEAGGAPRGEAGHGTPALLLFWEWLSEMREAACPGTPIAGLTDPALLALRKLHRVK